jgi:hypothetical protein
MILTEPLRLSNVFSLIASEYEWLTLELKQIAYFSFFSEFIYGLNVFCDIFGFLSVVGVTTIVMFLRGLWKLTGGFSLVTKDLTGGLEADLVYLDPLGIFTSETKGGLAGYDYLATSASSSTVL